MRNPFGTSWVSQARCKNYKIKCTLLRSLVCLQRRSWMFVLRAFPRSAVTCCSHTSFTERNVIFRCHFLISKIQTEFLTHLHLRRMNQMSETFWMLCFIFWIERADIILTDCNDDVQQTNIHGKNTRICCNSKKLHACVFMHCTQYLYHFVQQVKRTSDEWSL